MQIIACTTEQCVRGKCSKQTDRIGYESSEQLDVSNRLELLSAFDTEVQSVVDMTCETPCFGRVELMYWADKAILDGTWKPPLVKQVS